MDTLVDNIFSLKDKKIIDEAEENDQKEMNITASKNLLPAGFLKKIYDIYNTASEKRLDAYIESLEDVMGKTGENFILTKEKDVFEHITKLINNIANWMDAHVQLRCKQFRMSSVIAKRNSSQQFREYAEKKRQIFWDTYTRTKEKIKNNDMNNEVFVIMPINNLEMDEVWSKVFVPVIKKELGLEPRRIDKHNEGRTLINEITSFIDRAKIIIADVTLERPNCYLEIGIALGKDKFKNLIICAREDHHPDSQNFKRGGHKVHFDISGYDILFWEKDKQDVFKENLIKKIRQRLKNI
jgi:hypothetical protein